MTRVFKWSSRRSSKGFQNMPKQWLTVISGGNPRFKRWLSVISDGNPGLKSMAFRYFRRKPVLQNNGLLLLQIATRFSNMRKTRRQKDGCSSQRVSLYGLLYIHTPSGWCTLQCIISSKRKEIFFLSPNTLSFFLIFQESICAKLGGTMKVSEIKWFNFS